ncbi:MAG: GNAT family N-acetyltransferase [Chloroflexota bacterium]|nr:GNAT family N-acetyltransferase [Chloroflexota bacterium]
MTTETNDSNQPTIRLASIGDAGCIAVLCQQLGYPASQGQVQQRLCQIQQDKDHAVFVAEQSDGYVVGWVHVYIRQLVVTDLHAEIGGLVVDETCRRCGIGRLLMQYAEEWACGQGCWAVHLRSNVVRKGAHAFYEKIGYNVIKTQVAFRNVL